MLRKLVGALVALAVLAGGLGAAADKADKGKADDKGDCQVAGTTRRSRARTRSFCRFGRGPGDPSVDQEVTSP